MSFVCLHKIPCNTSRPFDGGREGGGGGRGLYTTPGVKAVLSSNLWCVSTCCIYSCVLSLLSSVSHNRGYWPCLAV